MGAEGFEFRRLGFAIEVRGSGFGFIGSGYRLQG